MKPADHRADLLAQNPFEGYALREGRGHPNPELRQGGRDLAADEAHAHDDRVAIRHGLALDRIALGHCPKLVDPGQLGAGDVEPPVPPAGGDQDLLVLDLLARIEDHLVRGGIHRGNGRLEPFDIVLLVPVGGSDVPAVEILLRPEVGLGQRGTTEWDPRLVADEHDSAPKPLIPKSRRGVPSGETATDDDDRLGSVLRGHRAHSFRARDRDEAAHAAAAFVLGLEIVEIRVDSPGRASVAYSERPAASKASFRSRYSRTLVIF